MIMKLCICIALLSLTGCATSRMCGISFETTDNVQTIYAACSDWAWRGPAQNIFITGSRPMPDSIKVSWSTRDGQNHTTNLLVRSRLPKSLRGIESSLHVRVDDLTRHVTLSFGTLDNGQAVRTPAQNETRMDQPSIAH